MATRFYLTKNTPPTGAPTTSKLASVSDSNDLFVGDYTPPNQGTQGLMTKIASSIPSYALTRHTARAGARQNVQVGSGTSVIQKISPGGLGTYTSHYQRAAGAVFSIRLSGVSSINGANIADNGSTHNVSLYEWGGHYTFEDDTFGPGSIGCAPLLYYVYRPSTSATVGVLARISSTDLTWINSFQWGLTTDDFYSAGACLLYDSFYETNTVTGIQAGDLLCVEYWCGRYLPNGTWTFDPWDGYPNSVPGDVNMLTGWNIPVGGDSDASSGTPEALDGRRSWFEASVTIGVAGDPGTARPSQVSVGF